MLSQILIEQGKQAVTLARIEEQLKAVPDHEKRLRKLEQFSWRLAGASTLGGIGSGAVGYWLGHVR